MAVITTRKEKDFIEKMNLLVEYYKKKSLKKPPILSEEKFNNLRKEVLEYIKEGYSSMDGVVIPPKGELTPEEKDKNVEKFYKWEIVVDEAIKFADYISPEVKNYQALLYELKGMIEDYQQIKVIESLIEPLLKAGYNKKEIEDIINSKINFSKDNSPYKLRKEATGIKVFINNYSSEELQESIKEAEKELKDSLELYKLNIEAWISYFEKIEMIEYITAAYNFYKQWEEMVAVNPFGIRINKAHLRGAAPHKESLFPDIIPFYYNIKPSTKEQRLYKEDIVTLIEKLYRKRRSINLLYHL